MAPISPLTPFANLPAAPLGLGSCLLWIVDGAGRGCCKLIALSGAPPPPCVRSAHSWFVGRGDGNQPAHFSGQADRAVIFKRFILLGGQHFRPFMKEGKYLGSCGRGFHCIQEPRYEELERM